jgi:hypothetical protein
MLPMPLLAGSTPSWVTIIVAVVALAVIWFVIRTVLKITMKVFAIGCLGLLILSGVAFVLFYKP